MSRSFSYPVSVEFGDCDPAGIVYFPNFFRWYDASSRNWFAQCGVPPWRETAELWGLVGTPLLDVQTKFVRSATYGDRIEVVTRVAEWNGKTFVQEHVIRRGDEVLTESREVRAFVGRHPDDPKRLKAIPAPPELLKLCGQ